MNTQIKPRFTSQDLSERLTAHIHELAAETDAARMEVTMIAYLTMCARFHRYSPQNIFLTLGDTTPGRTGTIMRSKDTGKTWEELTLPVQPNTAMWVLNSPPSSPNTIVAGSRYGYLYRSDDGGDTWVKLWREVSEISSVLCVPN